MRPRSQNPNGRGHTANQTIASQENFAIYLLRGMASALYHVRKVPALETRAVAIRNLLLEMVEDVHNIQDRRKQLKKGRK